MTVIAVAPELLSKATTSPATGNEAPDGPPVVADQLVVEFQLPVPPATRNRLATSQILTKLMKEKSYLSPHSCLDKLLTGSVRALYAA